MEDDIDTVNNDTDSQQTAHISDTPSKYDDPSSNDTHRHGEEKPHGEWGHNPDTWMVVITFILAIAGIVTIFIFQCQLREMRSQTRLAEISARQAQKDSVDASRNVERQLAISQQQATAAQSSVAAIDRQMRQDQRAWVGITNTEAPREIKENAKVVFNILFINSGKTPAKNVATRCAYRLLRSGDKLMPDQVIELLPRLRGGVIQPGAGRYFPLAIETPVTKDQADTIRSGAFIFYVFGDISYEDVFRKRHVTKWCLELAANPPPLGFSPCDGYNDAD